MPQPEFENFAPSEGVYHGPYPDTGDPYTVYYRHAFAVEEALAAKRISPEARTWLMRGLHQLFTSIHEQHTAQYRETSSRDTYEKPPEQ